MTEDEAQVQRIAPETAGSIRRKWGGLYTYGRMPREKGRSRINRAVTIVVYPKRREP